MDLATQNAWVLGFVGCVRIPAIWMKKTRSSSGLRDEALLFAGAARRRALRKRCRGEGFVGSERRGQRLLWQPLAFQQVSAPLQKRAASVRCQKSVPRANRVEIAELSQVTVR
jgi:hypothetical protein